MIHETIRLIRCVAAAVLIAACLLFGVAPAVLAVAIILLLAIIAAVPCILACVAGGLVGVVLGWAALWIVPSRDAIAAPADLDQPEPVPEDFVTNWGNPNKPKL